MARETAANVASERERENGRDLDIQCIQCNLFDWLAGWLADCTLVWLYVFVCAHTYATTNTNTGLVENACVGSNFFLFLLKLYWRFECETDWIISTLTQSMGGAYDYTIQPEANIQKQSGGLVFYHISQYTKRFDERKKKFQILFFFIAIIFIIFFYLFIYLLL